ncbi:MAG: hypothetical protein R3F59_24555 [Myxococcota bacterium]
MSPVILLLAGCTVSWPETAQPAGVFPHPSGYDAALAHGLDSLSPSAACGSCHGDADCAACHPTYPHTPAGDAVHATAVAGCEACHADPVTVAAAEAPCDGCHRSYPHPVGWDEAGQHGTYALDRAAVGSLCGPCHGTDLGGGRSGVGCGDCHASWPHPAGWDHGAAALPDGAACAGCHDQPAVAVACSSCHPAWPHPDDYAQLGHLSDAGRQGEGGCLICHAPGDGGWAMPSPCGARCHGGAP